MYHVPLRKAPRSLAVSSKESILHREKKQTGRRDHRIHPPPLYHRRFTRMFILQTSHCFFHFSLHPLSRSNYRQSLSANYPLSLRANRVLIKTLGICLDTGRKACPLNPLIAAMNPPVPPIARKNSWWMDFRCET